MQPSSASYRDTFQLVTVLDAARILGVSDSTVRRLVKAGKLEAEQVQRPQGHVWLVKVPSPVTEPSGTRHRLRDPAAAEPSAPPALAAWMTSVLEPLVAELRATRDASERKDQALRELERENGALAERLAVQKRLRSAAMAHAAELEARLDAAATRPPEPAPDPFPRPIPPTPNVGPERSRHRAPRWRRWLRDLVRGA